MGCCERRLPAVEEAFPSLLRRLYRTESLAQRLPPSAAACSCSVALARALRAVAPSLTCCAGTLRRNGSCRSGSCPTRSPTPPRSRSTAATATWWVESPQPGSRARSPSPPTEARPVGARSSRTWQAAGAQMGSHQRLRRRQVEPVGVVEITQAGPGLWSWPYCQTIRLVRGSMTPTRWS